MNLFLITDIWPFFTLIIFAYIFICNLDCIFPAHLYSAPQKYPAITGLRSLLSLSVFFHHAIIFYFYFKFGKWEVPPSNFYTLLGQVPVAIFFSITSFLFWQKILNTNSRLTFKSFIFSRIKRIAPAYLTISICIIFSILVMSQFNLYVGLTTFIKEVSFFIFSLGAIEVPSINNINPGLIGSGIFWTLRYEWKFYLIIPFVAYFFKCKQLKRIFYVALVSYFLFRLLFKYQIMPKGLLFFPGILCAHLMSMPNKLKKYFRHHIFRLMGAIALASIFIFSRSMYTYPSLLLLTLFFVALIFMEKRSWTYKILTSKSFLMTGQASYSIYIFHTFILFTILSLVNQYHPISEATFLIYWLLIALSLTVLIVISLLSYKYIEHPFLKKME